jgi:hypothetical protein
MATNNRPLKAYVRFDGSGRIVAGSLILRKNKPKVGKWKEIQAYECCFLPTTSTSSTTTTTTTAAVYSFSVKVNQTGQCDVYSISPIITIYSNSPALGEGVSVYYDSGLTNPITSNAYVCNCNLNISYRANNAILSAPYASPPCSTTTTTTTPAP